MRPTSTARRWLAGWLAGWAGSKLALCTRAGVVWWADGFKAGLARARACVCVCVWVGVRERESACECVCARVCTQVCAWVHICVCGGACVGIYECLTVADTMVLCMSRTDTSQCLVATPLTTTSKNGNTIGKFFKNTTHHEQ
jgi:hypothetical protein